MSRRRSPQGASGAGFDLRIEELVIDGYALAEGRALAAALETELGRLLADAVSPFAERSRGRARELAFDRLDTPPLTHAPGASPRAMGRSVAQAIVTKLRTLSTGQDSAPRRNA
jgi:hypothetical protein